MSIRKTPLIKGEYYHIFNRGVDKRTVFMDQHDLERFLISMKEFNTSEPIGSIRSLTPDRSKTPVKLVEIVAYCLNPNHYHIILCQVVEDGISRFLQKLGTGYTNYFNERYERKGALFQGKFKSVHIKNNEQLLHVSVYVNLNNKVHTKFDSKTDFAVYSSWKEYVAEGPGGFCKKDIVLGQFKNKPEYRRFAEDAIRGIVARRREKEEENTDLVGVFL